MKKLKLILLLNLILMSQTFSQNKYLDNLLKCGLPKLNDYHCYSTETIKPAPNPYKIPQSKFYNQFSIPLELKLQMELMHTTAFLVFVDDSLIFEKYFRDFSSDSIMNSFSMAKTITSFLVGIAIHKGYIKSLNQKVADFFPQFNNSSYGKSLTIRDLLNMASGLNWKEQFLNPASDIVKAYYGYPLLELIKQLKVVKKPNTKWSYQCINYILAGLIVQKSSGQSLAHFAQNYLWQPLGTSHFALWAKDPSSNIFRSFCCFYATARDFGLIGLMMLHHGFWNNQQIVPKAYFDSMLTPAKNLKYKHFKHVDFYKLGMWIYPKKKYQAYYMAGVYGQYVFALPKQNAVIVRLGQMVNQLDVMRLPPDVNLYLHIGTNIIQQYRKKISQNNKNVSH